MSLINGSLGNNILLFFFFSSRRRHTRYWRDWSSDVCSSDLRYPKISASPNSNWKYISDIYIDNADYFRMSNITLGYDFKEVAPRLPLSQLRLYISMNNLFTITGYKGMDPEVGYGAYAGWSQGVDIGNYPSTRTFIIGANIKF